MKVMYKVPFVDPRRHYRRLQRDIDEAISGCLSRGDLIMRQQLRDYEAHLADFVGTRYAVGLNSGFHALHFALVAAGVGPSDEVVTVAHTFVATISAIVHTGAAPVLVDVGPDYNMDMDALAKAVTSNTRAVIPVHLNGRLCDMARLMQIAEGHGLLVIEDAAQALGGTYAGRSAGSFGFAGCFSHYPFKILGGFGDGGALTTNDPQVARVATLLRYNGEDRETGEYHYHGYTALLDNVQAAVLDVKLRHLREWIDYRRSIAALYRANLEGVGDLVLPHFPGDEYRDTYQNYVIRTRHRNDLVAFLRTQGVETLVHWPKPVWRHPGLRLGEWHLPETEAICNEIVSLPMSTETTADQVRYVAETIRSFFERR
jgi:dTDP-4-amino-4,6-dideoxygalactose transaminase